MYVIGLKRAPSAAGEPGQGNERQNPNPFGRVNNLAKKNLAPGAHLPGASSPCLSTSKRGTGRISLSGGRSETTGAAFMAPRSYRRTQIYAAGGSTLALHMHMQTTLSCFRYLTLALTSD